MTYNAQVQQNHPQAMHNPSKWWPLVIGTGIALVPIHNSTLTVLATTSTGSTLVFIPVLAYILLSGGTGLFLLNHWEQVRKAGTGNKWIVLPMLVIVASMGISGLLNGSGLADRIAPLLMGAFLFGLYLTARTLGVAVLNPLAPFVFIAALVSIVVGAIQPYICTGSQGLITNADAAIGYLILGSLLVQGQWQGLLLTTTAVALFFMGQLEAVFMVGVVGTVVLLRRDMNWRSIAMIGLLIVAGALWTWFSTSLPMRDCNPEIKAMINIATGEVPITPDSLQVATSGRFERITAAAAAPLASPHGYSLSTVGGGIIHNTPLIIMYQIGPVGMVAWLFVSAYCLWKSKWKYAWTAVLAASVFDHWLWTQLTPYWWTLVGISIPSNIRTDLMFRRAKETHERTANVPT